jgi:hypothetical protein
VANRRLLLLFPRAWRDRHGEEFLALLGEGSLSASEMKGVPWKAQAGIIGGTLALLAAIGCVSAAG